jgi:hypothetical protein
MALSGSTVYIGGSFANAGGSARARIAALDTATNNATSWDPGVANGTVFHMVLSGTDLYIGGSFTSTVGGSTRTRLARLSTGSNTVTTWNPGINNGLINGMALSGTTLYVGGTFSNATVGGQSRSYLAALGTTTDTNNATSWNPGPVGAIDDVALAGSYLYAGGLFANVGETPRLNFAGVDTGTGAAQ